MKNRKNNIVSLYMHTRKDNGGIFYIGIGIKNRPFSDGKKLRSESWHEVVNEAKGFNVIILCENLIWDRACELEILMIAFYGRKTKLGGCLVNKTNGGDGCLGRIISKETRKKISTAQIKNYDIYLSQLEEKWGFNLILNKEVFEKEYKNQKSIITCECVLHGVFSRIAYDIIAKYPRGCYECMRIKKSKSMSEYIRTDEYRKQASESRKGIDYQTDEYKKLLSKQFTGGGNRAARIIIDINSGVYYECIKEVAELYKVSDSLVWKWLNNKNKNKSKSFLQYAP